MKNLFIIIAIAYSSISTAQETIPQTEWKIELIAGDSVTNYGNTRAEIGPNPVHQGSAYFVGRGVAICGLGLFLLSMLLTKKNN